MGGAGIDARDLDAWLAPLLDALGRKTRRDPPPLKWSVPRYGFEPEEDRDGEQEAPA